MKYLLHTLRPGLRDIVDASWLFLSKVAICEHTKGAERAWAEKKLADVARAGSADLSGAVLERVGVWDRMNASTCLNWCRRLMHLDHLVTWRHADVAR